MAGALCYLCGKAIDEKVEDEFWCYGCCATICGEHGDGPMTGPGSHQPEDHNEEPGEDED